MRAENPFLESIGCPQSTFGGRATTHKSIYFLSNNPQLGVTRNRAAQKVRPYGSIRAAQKVNVEPYYRSTRASAKIKCPMLFLIGITEKELKQCGHRAAQKSNVHPYP